MGSEMCIRDRRGDFYSSSGVMLDQLVRGSSTIEIFVNEEETACELASEFLFGRPVKKGKPGTFIEFIGPGGEIVKTVEGVSATCVAKGRTCVPRLSTA